MEISRKRKRCSTMTKTGKRQLFAVEKNGVEDDVLEMFKQNIPATKMSEILAEKGVKIAPLGLNRWLKARKSKSINMIETKSLQKFETMVMDYQKEIKDILDEVKTMKDVAIEEKKLDSYTRLVGKLFQGIELMAKLMGDIKPKGNIDINIILNEINKKSFLDNKGQRGNLFGDKIVDIEAEIVEEDGKAEKEIMGN